jgi:hypothetical protein
MKTGDQYVCTDPDCGSEMTVTQAPRSLDDPEAIPLCGCGSPMKLKSGTHAPVMRGSRR